MLWNRLAWTFSLGFLLLWWCCRVVVVGAHPVVIPLNQTDARVRTLLGEIERRVDAQLGVAHNRSFEESAVEEGLYENDIVLNEVKAEEIAYSVESANSTANGNSSANDRRRRKATIDTLLLWRMPIRFTFDGSHNETEKGLIREAIRSWQTGTCIDFIEVSQPKGFDAVLLFMKTSGCYSYVGRQASAIQRISIGPSCTTVGTIAHEIGHALGFWHEQSRPDRDEFVRIIIENVIPGKNYNFQRRSWGEINIMDIPYDPGSDLHYAANDFSRNGLNTIETHDRLMQNVIGQRHALSFYDKKLAHSLYCPRACVGADAGMCQRAGYRDPRDCRVCRCPDGFSGRFCHLLSPPIGVPCGGYIKLSANMRSLKGPPIHQIGQSCTWRLEAAEGEQISFRLSGVSLPCDDYLEIRYSAHLADTGGRFCRDFYPKEELFSSTRELMILLRTFGNSSPVDRVSCGCCAHETSERQRACRRRTVRKCKRNWLKEIRTDCHYWWQRRNKRCINKTAQCARVEEFCCDGCKLDKDGICVRTLS